MTLREFYDKIGVDPTNVLQRFGGSEAMLGKFVKKFLADGTFVQLTEAVAKSDWEGTFRAAHTLKGLSGNFDFLKIHELSSKIVERYRAGDFDAIAPLFDELKVRYEETVNYLTEFCGQN
ncbi:MAG: Hpt domain-containing protein [Clostridia bacterium]|jgi:HPt (histidine-containing phosphotransfer) domain-containing protein|nr:Hpt domain-containing protein [Clostridia bacterium]